MPRAKPIRPTRKMRQAALAALHGVVRNDSVPPYVRAKAAAALLNNGKEVADDPVFARDPDAPKIYAVLPDNGRQPDVRYGKYDEDQIVIIVPNGFPFEVQPESFYKDVPKPAPDPRIAMRNRAKTLALSALSEDVGA
jgi:hypothetical protein